MKQWNAAKTINFSILSLSLVAGLSFAQLIEIEAEPRAAPSASAAQSMPSDAAISPNLKSAESAMITQPVAISSGMAPQTIALPTMQPAQSMLPAQNVSSAPQATSTTTPGGMTVSAPSTGIGGNNPGNANTGGVQAQNVFVNTQQDAALVGPNGRAELLRRERLRREYENESRLVERMEQGRLEDESDRAKVIEQFNMANPKGTGTINNGAMIDTVPVTPIMIAPSMSAGSEMAMVSTEQVQSGSNGLRLSPFAGYRWFENNNSEFRANNEFTVGFTLEGQMNSMIGIEGNFAYGRDRFSSYNAYNGYGMNAGYSPNYANNGYAGYNNYNSYNSYGPSSSYLSSIRTRDSYEAGIGLKVGHTTRKVRPFAVVGIGGLLQRYNIDDAYTTAAATYAGWQRTTTHLLGDLACGMDVELSPNLSLGGRFDYQPILNRPITPMHLIYGDAKNRLRLTGNLQLKF